MGAKGQVGSQHRPVLCTCASRCRVRSHECAQDTGKHAQPVLPLPRVRGWRGSRRHVTSPLSAEKLCTLRPACQEGAGGGPSAGARAEEETEFLRSEQPAGTGTGQARAKSLGRAPFQDALAALLVPPRRRPGCLAALSPHRPGGPVTTKSIGMRVSVQAGGERPLVGVLATAARTAALVPSPLVL